MRRFVELMWLALAAITAVESYISFSRERFGQRTWLMIAVFCLSIFMYYLRKKQRIKSELRLRKKDQ